MSSASATDSGLASAVSTAPLSTASSHQPAYRKHHSAAAAHAPIAAASHQAAPSSQFKHTVLWNGIVSHLKSTLVEMNRRPNRLRKQQSRFVAASVGSMLMIKQNLMNPGGSGGASSSSYSSSTSSSSAAGSASSQQSPKPSSDFLASTLDLCFSGSQCVDIVYNYLTREDQIKNFQTEVTREKVTKLCQMIMNSGVFEPMYRSANNGRFQDTSLRFYKLKQSLDATVAGKNDEEDNEQASKVPAKRSKSTSSYAPSCKLPDLDKENKPDLLVEGDLAVKNMAFCKSRATPVGNKSSDSRLKRRLAVMKRSNTTGALSTTEIAAAVGASSASKETEESLPVVTETATNKSAAIPTETEPSMSGADFVSYNQILRELIIERILSLSEMPIVEHFLSTDKAVGGGGGDAEPCYYEKPCVESPKKSMFSALKHSSKPSSVPDENHNTMAVPSRFLAILSQNHDPLSTDLKEEWRKSAMEVLEFLDWERVWIQQLKDRDDPRGAQSFDKCVALVLMSDAELYGLIKDFYVLRRNGFLPESFTVLFDNILSFLRQSDYKKALEILNLDSLLLAKQVQAELKRLLKFLYLTANSTHAPRLNENKPNNSILLNHFASCLFQTKTLGFEDSRLILNFMLNNFNELFKMSRSLEESAQRRRLHMQKYGQEGALLETLFCKKITSQELEEASKEATTKALVELINHLIDDPKLTLKYKKLKLRALRNIHPDVYEKYFADVF